MFYDTFKSLCSRKGVSCNKAATDMGLSNSTPTKWKKTGATPDSKTLATISNYFGVSISYLLTGEQKEKPPVDDERFLPLAERREALSKAGIHILLDADAKVTEEQLDDIISFIEIQQRRNGR